MPKAFNEFDNIKNVANQASVTPDIALWNKLERKLDATAKIKARQRDKKFTLLGRVVFLTILMTCCLYIYLSLIHI